MKILVSIIMMAMAIGANAAMTAEQVLDKVAASFTKAASVTVSFSFTSNGNGASGTVTASGTKFSYSAGDLAVWYNGKTQWALQRSANEVTITEPTASELIESNPFKILSNYKKLYTCKLLSSTNGTYKVQLTAKSKGAGVKSAVVTVNGTTYNPTSIVATMSGKLKTTITVKSISKGKALPKSYFEYNTKMNKKIEVIDLR
jgi:outer membrane lipoprotein-sorting protein